MAEWLRGSLCTLSLKASVTQAESFETKQKLGSDSKPDLARFIALADPSPQPEAKVRTRVCEPQALAKKGWCV